MSLKYTIRSRVSFVSIPHFTLYRYRENGCLHTLIGSDQLYGRGGVVHAVAWSPRVDKNELVSASQDSSIQLWNAETCRTISGPLFGHEHGVLYVIFSPDGKRIVSCSDDGTIQIWNEENLHPLQHRSSVKHDRPVRAISISPDSRHIAYATDDKRSIQQLLVNLDDGTLSPTSRPPGEHGGVIHSVVYSPGGGYIASGSADKKVRVWNTKSPRAGPRVFTGHTNTVTSVAFSPDEKHVISGSLDGTVRIWSIDPPKNSEPRVLLPKGSSPSPSESPNPASVEQEVTALSISRREHGYVIAAASSDSAVRLWEITDTALSRAPEEKLEPVGTLKGYGESVHSVSFSPDGTRLATGSDNGVLMIWEIEGDTHSADDSLSDIAGLTPS